MSRKKLRLKSLVAFAAVLFLVTPIAAFANSFQYSGVTFLYSYTGDGGVKNTDCSNPARSANAYADIFRIRDAGPVTLYMQAAGLGDPFIQILNSSRSTWIAQDDDSGNGLDSFLQYPSSLQTDEFIAATTYSDGATGTYTLYSTVPLEQVFDCPQKITFTAPQSAIYGDTIPLLEASTNRSLTVTVTSQTPSVCSVTSPSNNRFSITSLHPGTCTLQATQAGNANNGAATPVDRNITINKRPVELGGITQTTKDYDGSTTVTLGGTPTIASGVVNSDVVSVSGTPTGVFDSANAGSRTINLSGLSLSGTDAAKYLLPTTVSGTISKINQTMAWSPNSTSLQFSNSGQSFTAATGEGSITYTIQNAGNTGCSVNSGTRALSFTGAGTCVVRASAAGNTNYNPATLDQSFTIQPKVDQVLTWSPSNTSLKPSETGAIFSAATSNSDGSISYSIQSAGTSGCTVNSGTRALSFSGVGVCTVRATSSGTNFNAATQDIAFTISKLNQSISWSQAEILKPSQSGNSLSAATSNGPGTITYSVTNAGSAGCSVTGSTISFTNQGTCTLRATAASTTDYNVATRDVSITVSKLNQVISWTPNTSLSARDTTQTLEAATTSGDGTVSYSVVSSGNTGCALSGRTLSFTGAGTCKVKATAASTSDYNVASEELDLIISLAPQVVTWSPATSVSVSAGTLTPSTRPASSGSGTISYSVSNAGTSACTVNPASGVLTFAKAGDCQVRATSGSTPTESSAYAEVTFTISPASQTVSWGVTNTTADTSVTSLTPSTVARSSGSGTISYSVVATSGTGCRVNAQTGVLTFTSAGTCTVRASAASTDSETAAFTEVTFTISRANPVATPTPSPSPTPARPEVNLNRPIAMPSGSVVSVTSGSGSTQQVTIGSSGLPELRPLQSLALVEGAPVPVQVSQVASNTALKIDGGEFNVTLSASSSSGVSSALSSRGELVLTTGNFATFSGTGFAPNSEIVVWLFSTPTKLGTVVTDASGSFSGSLAVPSDLEAGQHTVQLNGETSDGETRSLAVGVELVAEESQEEQTSEEAAAASIGATGDDNAPPVPFDPLSSPEGVTALTATIGAAAAAAGAIAAAAGAAAGAAGSSSGGSARGGASSGGGNSGGDSGSIATIDAAHERYRNRRRGKGDRWKIWKKRWLNFLDKPFISLAVKSARFSPLFSKISVDGAYLRASMGAVGLLPTVAAAFISAISVSMNETAVAPPQWQWFIALAVIGIFDAFAGLIGTSIFVIGTVIMHGAIGVEDIRLLLGVMIVGYGPALLANAFRAFRKEPENSDVYWWDRLIDLAVLPFIGGWITATMISTLPALAGTTLSVANHVDAFAIAIAVAIMARVILEELVARWFPKRLDTLHPTDVDETDPPQKWISVAFRLAVFIFVTAALMGNVWQVWVGSALFILPTIIGFYSDRFKNFPWLWRLLPTGVPGLAVALLVASATTSVVGMWFGTSPDLALWSFALLPIPMLFLAVLGMFGREGVEDEVRFIQRPQYKWVYRIGGIVMLLVTMNLAGVI